MNFHHLINNKTKVSIYQKHSRSYFYLKRFYLFIFRERGREGERAGEKLQCEVASHMPPTGDLVPNPGICPDRNRTSNPLVLRPALNPLSHTSQGRCCKIFKDGIC